MEKYGNYLGDTTPKDDDQIYKRSARALLEEDIKTREEFESRNKYSSLKDYEANLKSKSRI